VVIFFLFLLFLCLWYAEVSVYVPNLLASMSIKHRMGQLALVRIKFKLNLATELQIFIIVN